MASTYSTSLKIQLMTTGENSTTWGNVTNVNLGTTIEEAIVGSATVTFASDNQTISLSDSNASQTARNLRLVLAGTTGGSTRTLTVPSVEKPYIVSNTNGDTVTVKTSAGSGVDVPAGKTMWVYCDGTDVLDVVTHLSSFNLSTSGNVSAAALPWDGDSDTGPYHPAADTYAITVGGVQGMYLSDTTTDPLAFGANALDSVTLGSGVRNSAFGYDAGTAITTGDDNTLVGWQSGINITTGAGNISIGRQAGGGVTTSNYNTCLGFTAGYGNTGSYNTVLGSHAVSGSTHTGDNLIVIGYNAYPTASNTSNEITLGNSSITNLRCNDTTISTLSDERDKKDIETIPLGLDFIEQVQPRMFVWDRRDGSRNDVRDFGFIAQELDIVEQDTGYADCLRLVHKENPDFWEADPMKMFPVLVKAVQELSAKVKKLEEANIRYAAN